jgi:hypothetical protein
VAPDASQDDDVSVVLRAQQRQRRFDEVDVAEEDGFELLPYEVEGEWGGGEFFDAADDS